MPDWKRMEMVPEILTARGAEFPSSRQVPFLDSHQRRSIKDQLGSAREITVENGQMSSRLFFRKSSEADDALGGVRDGHITDVSVGYDVLKRQYIPAGETQTIGERSYKGPVNVVTKWRLREVSLTPIGADDQAKLRGLDPATVQFQSSEKEVFTMNAELRALLVSKGMPESHTDEQAQRWLIDNASKLAEVKEQPKEKEERSQQTLPTAADLAKLVADATRQAIADANTARKAFEVDVRELCELADMVSEIEVCRQMEDLAAVRKHIKDTKAANAEKVPYGGSARILSTGVDRLKTDLRSTLIARACDSALGGKDDAKYITAEERKQSENFRHASLFDMATEFVRASGIQTFGLTREQIAICAMFGPEVAGVRAGAYHSTGSFANITLDAVNKSMMIGYSEVPATWRGPMKQGMSVGDFKNIHRTQLGAIPNLPVWNDSVRPDLASMADSKETYAVEARSIGIDFGYKLIVNDDMSALTSTPRKLGDASARTVNAVAWSQVTSNPQMRDGAALFLETPAGLRFRKNLTTGAATPTTTAIGPMKALMRLMRGENTPEGAESSDILNLTPSYLVVPPSLETTAEVLVNSTFDPASSGAATYNPQRSLTLVVEPLLEAASAKAFYLFADPNRVETVEVTFLTGQETPQVRKVIDEHTLATTYYILQSVTAKALDHRGVQKHNGE